MKGTAPGAAAGIALLQKNALAASELLKALANPSRLMILCQLADGEKSVGELERVVGLSQSGLSQHLALLRRQGIVSTRRDAQFIYYALASDAAIAVMRTLYDTYCAPVAPRRRTPKAALSA